MTDVGNLRVLIVDDEQYIRTVIRKILLQMQIEKVYEAPDGGEGFMQALRVRPDIILSDVHMEPVDGLKLLSTVRRSNDERISNIPIVLLTSDSHEDTVLRAKDLVVSGYLVKPVSLADVKKTIGRVLNVAFP